MYLGDDYFDGLVFTQKKSRPFVTMVYCSFFLLLPEEKYENPNNKKQNKRERRETVLSRI